MAKDFGSLDPVLAYAKSVISGETICGRLVKRACLRHVHDLEHGPSRGLKWDLPAALRFINFCRDVLRLNGGQFEGKPFILQPWQCFALGSLFGWKNADGNRRFRTSFTLTGKGPLALDTPIATPDGWTTMGELKVGDHVFDDQGKPTLVTEVSEVFYGRPCYRMTFSDGGTIVADSEHRWNTAAMRSGVVNPRGWSPNLPRKGGYWKRTTEEIAKTLKVRESSSVHPQAKWNHRVDVAPALELPEVDLPIPPYTLGAYLGDGDTDSSRITVAISDWEIVEHIRAEGVPVVEQKRHAPHIARVSLSEGMAAGGGHIHLVKDVLRAAVRLGRFTVTELATAADRDRCRTASLLRSHPCFSKLASCQAKRDGMGRILGRSGSVWCCNGADATLAELEQVPDPVLKRLRGLGIIGDKHIPEIYLRASKSQRLALLQGLCDTDGTTAPGGRCEIALCNRRLVGDVLALLRTLGFKAQIHESDAKIYGRVVGKRWRICFQAYRSLPPFRLKRKADRLGDEPATRALSRGRMIVGCDPVESVPVRCITVAADSHMFLAGETLVPTCNSGKSPMSAAVGIYMLLADGEERSEVYAAAAKLSQAQILFRDAVAMVTSSTLKGHCVLSGAADREWNIAFHPTHSWFRPISSEKNAQSGPRPHCALLDEIHEHPTAAMVDMMRAGTKARRQALIYEITNAPADSIGVCANHQDYARKLVDGFDKEDGLKNDAFFAYVCQLDMCPKCEAEGQTQPKDGCPDCDNWRDERCWPKANPSLPVTPGYTYLREQVAEAQGMPTKENSVKRLNFCLRTRGDIKAIPVDAWEACGRPLPEVLSRLAPHSPCHGAIDIGSTSDFTAFVQLFPHDDVETLMAPVDPERPEMGEKRVTRRSYSLIPHFWLPQRRLARDKALEIVIDRWIQQGLINETAGDVVDYDQVLDDIKKMDTIHPFTDIALDYGFQGAHFATNLQKYFGEDKIVAVHQGIIAMNAPFRELIELVKLRRLIHGRHPVLSWMVSNCAAETRGGLIKPSKDHSADKIDGITAACMGLHQGMLSGDSGDWYTPGCVSGKGR